MAFIKSFLWLPALIGFIVYIPALKLGSAWGDDIFVISREAKNFFLMIKSFYSNTPALHFVPMCMLQSYLINSIFGKSAFPFWFHLYDIVLHVISCFLAALILFKLTKSNLISILIVSLWTVHPINVENLTRLGCGPAQVAAGMFCLVFLICFLKVMEESNVKTKLLLVLLGIIFFIASLTSYEQYFLVPLFLLFFARRRNISGNFWSREYLFYYVIPICMIYPIYLGWKYLACGGSLFETSNELIKWTETGSLNDILFRAFWLSPQLIVHYFRLFFWPDYLAESKADWYFVGDSVFSFYSLFCQIFVVLLLISCWLLKKIIPLYSVSIMWFFTTMVLVLQIIPTFSIVDEHYCYLSSVGLFLTFFSILDYFKRFISKRMIIIFTTFTFIVLLWRTELYIPSGKDFLTHHIYMAKEAPPWNKHTFMASAIDLANKENRTRELPGWISEKSFEGFINMWIERYLNLKPTLYYKFGPMQMLYNFYVFRGVFKYLAFSGQRQKLIDAMNTALRVDDSWVGYYEIARILKILGDLDNAWNANKKAIENNPVIKHVYDNQFVEIALGAKKVEEAEKLLIDYINLCPHHSYPYLVAGKLHLSAGNLDKALTYFSAGISKDKIPSVNYGKLYDYAAVAFAKGKRYSDMMRVLNVVLSFDPDNTNAQHSIDALRKFESLLNSQNKSLNK